MSVSILTYHCIHCGALLNRDDRGRWVHPTGELRPICLTGTGPGGFYLPDEMEERTMAVIRTPA